MMGDRWTHKYHSSRSIGPRNNTIATGRFVIMGSIRRVCISLDAVMTSWIEPGGEPGNRLMICVMMDAVRPPNDDDEEEDDFVGWWFISSSSLLSSTTP